MTAPKDAPAEERHRRAAVVGCGHATARAGIARFIALGDDRDVSVMIVLASQVAANAERDGRASRDAEVAELQHVLRAYRATWARAVVGGEGEHFDGIDEAACNRILAEELARKGTP